MIECFHHRCECSKKKITDERGVTQGDRPMFSGKKKGSKAAGAEARKTGKNPATGKNDRCEFTHFGG